jgi:hypothetical protein
MPRDEIGGVARVLAVRYVALVRRWNTRARRISAGPALLACAALATAATARADEISAKPPELTRAFFQYGLSFTGEAVASAGPMCTTAAAPCIFGSGGGVAARVGRRARTPWYFGVAYEFSKHDPAQLYRLAILQQLRFEARYYLLTSTKLQPFVLGAAGVNAYGNLWGVDTFGAGATLGAGVEAQVAYAATVGLSLGYRVLGFTAFTDSSQTSRDAGFAHVFGIDLSLETREPL